MHFITSFAALMTLALGVVALPSPNVDTVRLRSLQRATHTYLRFLQGMVTKRETSYGNPDLVVDQGDRWKLNFGSTDGHPNACPGHCQSFVRLVEYMKLTPFIDICYIGKGGSRHGDESWGNPDDMVDEG